MKTISVIINISSGAGRPEAMRYEKTGPGEEIEVLASAISTIFLRSKEAHRLARSRQHPVLGLTKEKKKRR